MHLQDRLYNFIMNFNLGKDRKQRSLFRKETNIYESPDGGKTVYVRKSNQDPKFRSRVIINHDDPFIEELVSKGYTFDIGNSWYRRRWTTNNGAESIEEIYQMIEHGDNKSWKHLMIGYNNEIFYEEPVGELSLKGKVLQQSRHGGDMDAL